eukprot:Skav210331  [mRNA]  locus=scaffold475:389880:398041:- [translate_table: standard]
MRRSGVAEVAFVAESGPAYHAGVRASSGSLAAMACHAFGSAFEASFRILRLAPVLLRFQSPNLEIATLELDDLVNCAVPSHDGTLLAVGCKKHGGGPRGRKSVSVAAQDSDTIQASVSRTIEGSRKSATGLLESTHSTLSVWSLETREFWRAKEVHLTASIPALCWLNSSELVVVLRDMYAVGVVNIESGALVQRWSFGTWRPEVIAATNCCPWIAVGMRTGKSSQCRVTVFSAKGGGCILPAAVSSKYTLTRLTTGHANALPAVASNETGHFLAVFRLPSDKWPRDELYSQPLDHGDRHRTVAVKSYSDGFAGIAAVAGSQSGQFVGFACWTGQQVAMEKLRCAKLGMEVVDLAFLPGQDCLAGLVNLKDPSTSLTDKNAGSICCIWNLSTPGMAQLCCEVRLHSSPRGLSCMAVGHDFQRRQREEDRRVPSPPPSGRRLLSHAGLVTDTLPSVQVATSGDNSHVVVHEIRTGFRTFFDISQDAEGARRLSAVPRILRFASSGRLLAVGDNCGQVHLFQLGRSASEAANGRAIPAHRVLCLSGEVVDVVLHDEQLARVACWHAPQSQHDEKEEPDSEEQNKILVYDLLNPCLEFLLPDLKMQAEDDLMTVLMGEHRSAADYGHAWDQLGENGEDSEQEEIMRTKFVHVLLEEQWNKLGYKQFRRELVVYFLYLISWAAWCMAGRSSCPPPPTLGEDLGHLAGAMASQGFRGDV